MKKMLVIASVILSATISFAQSSTVSASNSASTTGAGTLAAPSTIVEPIKKASKWSSSLFYAPYAGLTDANRGDANDSYATDAFVQVRRDIGNGQKLALRVNGAYNSTDATRNDEWALMDPQFLYSFPVFASTLRLSLPVSDFSQDVGKYELRYNGGNDLFQSGKFTVTSLVEGRVYTYTEEEDGQRSTRARLGASAIYEINSFISPYVLAFYQSDSYFHGAGQASQKGKKLANPESRIDTTVVDAGAEMNLIPKTLHLNAYVEQERRRDVGADKQLFAESDSSYYLEFTLSM